MKTVYVKIVNSDGYGIEGYFLKDRLVPLLRHIADAIEEAGLQETIEFLHENLASAPVVPPHSNPQNN